MKSATKNHQRGIGAAHGAAGNLSRMFGYRGPLLAPEGDGNGAGGSGGGTTSTSTTTTTTEGTPGTAPAGGNGEKLIPQSQVNALVAQARREGRESATQTNLQTQQPNGQQQTTTNAPSGAGAGGTPLTAEAVQQMMARERAFTRATATAQFGENADKKIARMEAAFRAENPSDVAAWSAAYLTDMGFASSTTQQQNPNGSTQQTQTGATVVAAATTVPGRVDPNTSGGLVDMWNMSMDQIDQLGPEGIRAEHEKILAHAHKRAGAPPVPRVMQRK